MIDAEGRRVDYLRVSITDRCNLRCVYCMPAQGVPPLAHAEVLRFEEILRVVRVMAAQLGLRRVKITGGEPLVRRGCPELIRALKALPGIEAVTLTTNGLALAPLMPQLAAAGVDAINISLDTLDPAEFARITRRPGLEAVLAGIRAAQQYPQIPLKLNVVPIAAQDETLLALAGLARSQPLQVRFIEMMPIGLGSGFGARREAELLALLEQHYGALTPAPQQYGNGPGRYYAVPGFVGRVGFISALSHKFCGSCNRVRLTADGRLKACLQYDTGCDLRALLRAGATDAQLCAQMRAVIWAKPPCHQFGQPPAADAERRAMSQIGG